MLRIHQLTLLPEDARQITPEQLKTLCAAKLKMPAGRIAKVRMIKRGVDARKGNVRVTLSADVLLSEASQEKKLAGRFAPNEVVWLDMNRFSRDPDVFRSPAAPWPEGKPRPVVVGAGPAGLFCTLALAKRGARPILLERGKPVDERAADISRLETEGLLDPESNVLFGEGGAGTFSDGKLTCGTGSPHIRTVLETFVTCGAPEEILTAQHPHIGTDRLRDVLKRMRARALSLGAEIHFGTKMTGLDIRDGKLRAVLTEKESIETDTVCICVGHSARDTVEKLYALGLPMQQKPFAMGCRIEHPQRVIDKARWGHYAGSGLLPAADYKLNVPTEDKRGVYTFCMCPGGQVINASSEADGVNVNGMSLHARDGRNANAALLVGVRPEDFGSEHPLAGIALQRQIERAAFRVSGSMKAIGQRVGDLLEGKASAAFGEVQPTCLPGVIPGRISDCLPGYITDNLRAALPKLGRMLSGFDMADALLTAPETRSSSPVRMLRNERRESAVSGVYPLGEGAGYAGGIVSAAVDGLLAGFGIAAEE